MCIQNRKVPECWRRGESAQGHGSLRTDGQNLYSYDLKIGYTENGEKIVIDYRGCQSVTTSKHVGYAMLYADRTDIP